MYRLRSNISFLVLISTLVFFSSGHLLAKGGENAEEKRAEKRKKEKEKSASEEARKKKESENSQQENEEEKVKRVSEDKPVSENLGEEMNEFGQKMAACRQIKDSAARRQCRKQVKAGKAEAKKPGATEVVK